MAKLVFGMMQSLDGYVDHATGELALPPPDLTLHDHFADHVRSLAGILYGRRMYEVLRFWDGAHAQLDAGYVHSRRSGGHSRNGSHHGR